MTKGSSREYKADGLDRYFAILRKYRVLSLDEELELGRQAIAGDESAREKLVLHNLRFVITYVKKYQNRGLDMDELISIGNEQLFKAARKYDPDKGVKFISYAVWNLKQGLDVEIAKSRMVYAPPNTVIAARRVDGALADAKIAGVARENALEDALEKQGLTQQNYDDVKKSAETWSIDEPINEHGKERIEQIADDGENVLAALEQEGLVHLIDKALASEPERNRTIFKIYHGLDGTEPRSLEETGALFGITRERVRQINNKILSRLKKAPTGKALWEYYKDLF